MNTKQKGNIGIGQALAYFTLHGYTISIPINDSQDYDLVVDIDGILHAVQVKYTTQKAKNANNDYVVGLRSISGSSRETYKTLSEANVDYLFIVSENLLCYLVPICDITQKSMITLNKEYFDKYGVMGEWLKPASC